MSTYDDIRVKVEQLGGSAGPAGVGSINLHGGTEIKIKYDVPGPGTRNVSVVPYLIGSDQSTSTSPPPVDHQTLLAWQYKPDPGSSGAASLEMLQGWENRDDTSRSSSASISGKFADIRPRQAKLCAVLLTLTISSIRSSRHDRSTCMHWYEPSHRAAGLLLSPCN